VNEFLNANPVLVELIILDNSGPRVKAGRQRFARFHEVAAGVEADLRTCIERVQVSMALTATATRHPAVGRNARRGDSCAAACT
jgi:hypothetical protein